MKVLTNEELVKKVLWQVKRKKLSVGAATRKVFQKYRMWDPPRFGVVCRAVEDTLTPVKASQPKSKTGSTPPPQLDQSILDDLWYRKGQYG